VTATSQQVWLSADLDPQTSQTFAHATEAQAKAFAWAANGAPQTMGAAQVKE